MAELVVRRLTVALKCGLFATILHVNAQASNLKPATDQMLTSMSSRSMPLAMPHVQNVDSSEKANTLNKLDDADELGLELVKGAASLVNRHLC
jgi:hypothetical protein